MQDILGLANCASKDSIFNTGVPLCDLAKKKIKGVIFADKGTTFSGADIASTASFIAAVKTKTTAARGGRVYPVWDILNFEDTTGDPSTGAVGNLSNATIITQDASPAFRFGYNGSEARAARMAAMNGASLDMFIVDDQFAVYGASKNGGFGGFSVLQAYHYTTKFITGDAVNQYSFRVTLGDISEYRDTSTYVVTNSGILAAVGLINIQQKKFDLTSNVLKVEALADGGTNLEPLYGAELAAETWTLTNLDTGENVAITSVAKDDADDVFVVTIDTTAYTAAASGTRFQLDGPTAADMSAAGVKPFEFVGFVFEKP